MANPCVGIDLGTTYSALAVINPAGTPELVPNSDGERYTRSAVFFDEDGSRLVGQEAVSMARAYPDRVVQWVKRNMGDEDWSFSVDGRSYSAIEISAIILKKIKQDAESLLGPIAHAVITVPAYFDESRRVATLSAAKLAGMDVLSIINEPTAASIAYASSGGRAGTFLVYDFGGGTFDVTVVKVKDLSDVEVIASGGDHKLGGHDLDESLAEHYKNVFASATDVQIPKSDHHPAWHDFMELAERDKRTLSKRTVKKGSMLQWEGHSLCVDTNREEFERLIADKIVQTEMLVDNVLADAQLEVHDISEVLLVGGSTRIPMVQQMLARKFGKEPISPMSVDEAVALGAAIRAGMIMQERGLTELVPDASARLGKTRVVDVTAHSLGTIAVGDVGGAMRPRNTIIVPRNSPIPTSETRTFYTMHDGQTEVKCTVTQGEDEDPEFVRVLLEENMKLPANRPEGCPIEIRYSYDSNGVMKFEFKDVQSGRTKVLESQDARRAQSKVESFEADFEDLEVQ